MTSPSPSLRPRRRPRQERSRDTVAVLMTATERVLVERGYDALTTTRVAAVAGVSVGSLYQYFPGREALVAELLRRRAEATAARLEASVAATRGRPLGARLAALLDASISAKRAQPGLAAMLSSGRPELEMFESKRHVPRRARALVVDLLAEHRPGLAPEAREAQAFAIVAAVEGVLTAAAREDRLDDPNLRAAVTVLTRGLSQ